MAEQSVFFGGRQSSGLSNLLLFLNLLGIIIIIILLLWWWPQYWGRGAQVIGGTAVPGQGGNIIIDTCCDGGSRDCPGDKTEDCKDYCKKIDPSGGSTYTSCIRERCGPPPGDGSCKDKCHDRYPTNSLMESECIRVECDDAGGCPEDCWKRYSTNQQAYQTCLRTECQPPPPPTENCEDYCKTVYGSPGMENYYQQCLRERCDQQPTGTVGHPKQPDCKDSDGYNLAAAGKVVYGDETHSDTCYSSTEVTEWVCDKDGKPQERREPCEGRCAYGACVPGGGTTTPQNDPCTTYCQQAYGTSGSQYVQQCIQQHWCPT